MKLLGALVLIVAVIAIGVSISAALFMFGSAIVAKYSSVLEPFSFVDSLIFGMLLSAYIGASKSKVTFTRG